MQYRSQQEFVIIQKSFLHFLMQISSWHLHVTCCLKTQLSPQTVLNPLSNDKILALTKFKAFADNKFSISTMMVFVSDMVQNSIFLLLRQCFSKVLFLGRENSGSCGKELRFIWSHED